jgi:lipopolysaccharide export LptBFGC system permease protein LptF
VLAAVFTLAWMNHTNELTAMLASGVSLRRVLLPMVLAAVGLNLLVVVDNELVIPHPKVRRHLTHSHDDPEGLSAYQVRTPIDRKGSCFYSLRLMPKDRRMINPLIILRDGKRAYLGKITAPAARHEDGVGWVFESGHYSGAEPRPSPAPPMVLMSGARALMPATTAFVPSSISPQRIIEEARARQANRDVDWDAASALRDGHVRDDQYAMTLVAGRMPLARTPEGPTVAALEDVRFEFGPAEGEPLVVIRAERAVHRPYRGDVHEVGWVLTGGRMVYESDLTPDNLSLRQSSEWLEYMSTGELTRLLQLQQVPDRRRTKLLRQSRYADMFNHILLLLLVAPFVLHRERNLKSSAGLALLVGVGFFIFIYVTRNIAIEPVLAAWLPLLVFGPVAAVMVEAIRT